MKQKFFPARAAKSDNTMLYKTTFTAGNLYSIKRVGFYLWDIDHFDICTLRIGSIIFLIEVDPTEWSYDLMYKVLYRNMVGFIRVKCLTEY